MNLSETARKYIGKIEKPGNMGFNDLTFETKMIAVGFEKKQAWSSYAVELWTKEGREGYIIAEKNVVLVKSLMVLMS